MDEIAVPISWFRQPQNQDALTVDPMYVRGGEMPTTNSDLQDNKTPPTVAVYLLQFYPVTQACVQPCVTATSSQFTTSTTISQQLPLEHPSSAGTRFVSQSSQTCPLVQNVDVISTEEKPTAVKLEPMDLPLEQQVGAVSREEKPTAVKLEPISLPLEQQEMKKSNQCLVIQDNIVPTTKVPFMKKWRGEVEMEEYHVNELTRWSQENPVHIHQTNNVSQGSSGILSVRSLGGSNVPYASDTFPTFDQSSRTQPGEKPYSCNVCGKVFARAHNLKAHSQTHSGALPFPCKICRKSYSQEAYYRIHSEILSGGRPYTCEVCSKVFCNSRSFNFHVRSHSRRKVIT